MLVIGLCAKLQRITFLNTFHQQQKASVLNQSVSNTGRDYLCRLKIDAKNKE